MSYTPSKELTAKFCDFCETQHKNKGFVIMGNIFLDSFMGPRIFCVNCIDNKRLKLTEEFKGMGSWSHGWWSNPDLIDAIRKEKGL